LLVVPIEPLGAEVVVELAVIAVVRKYKPAVAFATTASVVAVDVMVGAVISPVTDTLSNSGSEYATPTALVLAMIYP
jgi:hypothetical protein